MNTTYSVTHQAYLKAFLHAAKYPHKHVSGVFIGSKTGQEVTLTDAIPILHNWTNLSSMMSVGMDLASSFARKKGEMIVGFYQSTDRLNDTFLTPGGEKVASFIRESFPDTVALVIDGSGLSTGEAAIVPYVMNPGGKSWTAHPSSFSPYSPFSLQCATSPQRCLELMNGTSKLHRKIHDFDEHLEHVNIDWLQNQKCSDAGFTG